MSLDNVCIKNEFLTVTIKTLGAELTSIKDAKGTERLHQPDMVFWNGQAPVLFPVCGTPRDKKIISKGKEYQMGSHGFARHCEFNLMECTEDLAVFSLISNDETKKQYPFDFELIITYKLLGNSIDVSYEIINDGNDEMYFSIGSHEGYNCLEGLSEYEIDHVFLTDYHGEVNPDPDEIMELRWVSLEDLKKEMEDAPQNFSTWFLIAAPRVMEYMIK